MKESKRNGLPFLTRLAYGSGNFASNLMAGTAVAYISYYYTDIAGLPVAAVGVILLMCRLLDGITDLIMGGIVEKTNTPEGKARPWIKRMAIPFGIATFLLFFSPGCGMVGKIIYAGATYVIGIAIIYTAISVPYNTLSALMSKTPQDMERLATMRTIFGLVGPLLIMTVSLPIVNALGGDQRAWSILAAIYGALGTILFLWVYFSSEEKDSAEVSKTDNKAKISIKEKLKELFGNKYWIFVITMSLIIFIMNGIQGGVMVYYCKDVFKNANIYSLFSIAALLPSILSCFFMPALFSKVGKRNASLGGFVITTLSTLVMMMFSENLPVFIAAMVASSFGSAPMVVALFAMLGDVAAYGEWKNGKGGEGFIFSSQTFAEKAGGAIGGAITSFVLAAGGYVGTAEVQSASAIMGMKVCMLGIPLMLGIVLIVLLFFYDLDKKLPAIMAER